MTDKPKTEKDLLAKLADAGEDALNRLSEAAPVMERLVVFAKSTRKQLDELTRRVQGLTALEGRVAKLEKQVATLTKNAPKRAPARKAPPTAAP